MDTCFKYSGDKEKVEVPAFKAEIRAVEQKTDYVLNWNNVTYSLPDADDKFLQIH